MTDSSRKSLRIGEILTVEIEKLAHGGHFIARHEGAVIFIRHVIPGEIVEVEISEIEKSFARAELRSILQASPDRVVAPCKYAHPSGCGGCDFQHIAYEHQRKLKSQVIAEQFSRIAKMDIDIEVEEVSAPLHWRTRFAATSTVKGELGFKEARSHQVVPIDSCVVVSPEIDFPSLPKGSIPANSRVEVALSSKGRRTVATSPLRNSRVEKNPPLAVIEGDSPLIYQVESAVGSLKYQVSFDSFWQSNSSAPTVLIDAVLAMADIKPGDHLLDLYGGVGLFARAAVTLVGNDGKIDLVEASSSATRDARHNFRDFPNVKIHCSDVARGLDSFTAADIVLLDPPRTGAGAPVITSITALNPRSIIYIACDPAALARDTGYLREQGYELSNIRAFDLFPMTHHIESVALYTPAKVS